MLRIHTTGPLRVHVTDPRFRVECASLPLRASPSDPVRFPLESAAFDAKNVCLRVWGQGALARFQHEAEVLQSAPGAPADSSVVPSRHFNSTADIVSMDRTAARLRVHRLYWAVHSDTFPDLFVSRVRRDSVNERRPRLASTITATQRCSNPHSVSEAQLLRDNDGWLSPQSQIMSPNPGGRAVNSNHC
jgi:hypothetical protein